MRHKLLLALLLGLSITGSFADSNLNRNDYIATATASTLNAEIPANFVEIDTAAYTHNLQEIRKMIGTKPKICVVMKSDAYGHGINNLIDSALKANVDYIAAVDNSEFRILAAKIKAHGKNTHLLRIAPATKAELIQAQTNNWQVEEIAGSLNEAKMLNDTAIELSHKLHKNIVVAVHINIETGMGRMGLRNVNDIRQIMAMSHLKVVGVMTHFAKDYEDPPTDYIATRTQLDIFESMVNQLNLDKNVIQHVANSGAAAKFPWARKDMVRVGSLTYGEDLDDYQDPQHVLKPVMKSFKSTVVIVESNVPPHSPINYDGLQYTRDDKPSTTATLRVGYNYGFPQYAFRENGSTVLIRGQRFPVLGKTSMNMVVIDVTDQNPANPVHLGDEAVLVGAQESQTITWSEFAKRNKMGITEQVLLIGNQNMRNVVESR